MREEKANQGSLVALVKEYTQPKSRKVQRLRSMDSDSFVVGDSRSANSLAWVDTEKKFHSSSSPTSVYQSLGV